MSDSPAPADYQPPLRWWSHLWRILLCLLFSAIVLLDAAPAKWERDPWLLWLDIGLGLVSYVVVFWRRRWPLTIAIVITAMSIVSGIAAGPASLAAVSLATRRNYVQIVIVGVFSFVCAQAYLEFAPGRGSDPLWLTTAINLVSIALMMAWGLYIGSRRELLWTLQRRAVEAEEQSYLRSEGARTAERARIAREMHDVLAHRISQVSMQAGALAFRTDLSADQLRAGVGEVQAHANEALSDLRSVLGVLRGAGGEVLDAPQPVFADVETLIEEARAAGMQVDYAAEVSRPEAVPLTLGRTVYRIVQEGLTNARKHAPGATVRIRIRGDAEEGVDVQVENPLGFGIATTSVPSSGLGLIGLNERAALRGGRLDYRKTDTSWVLHGWLPWPA